MSLENIFLTVADVVSTLRPKGESIMKKLNNYNFNSTKGCELTVQRFSLGSFWAESYADLSSIVLFGYLWLIYVWKEKGKTKCVVFSSLCVNKYIRNDRRKKIDLMIWWIELIIYDEFLNGGKIT